LDTDKYGGRTDEALYYMAEIISKFDIVAVQEVRKDLTTLKKLMGILGGYWEYMFTDVTEGRQGNQERLTFVFDTRKVRFGGLAGELVLSPMSEKDPKTGQNIFVPSKQLARTPYICGFKAGWTDFILTTVHILYGKNAAEDPNRVREIRELAQSMAARTQNKFEWSRNMLLLGDFNIYSPKDSTMKAITDAGFTIPAELQSLKGSNVEQNKFYDQIAFKVRPKRFETTGKAGIFDFYKLVFRQEDEKLYAERMGPNYKTKKTARQKSTYYKKFWRTFQLSDHLPMWVEICIDHTDAYLRDRLVPPQAEDEATSAPSKEAHKTRSARRKKAS
jgi:exonuclease III